MLVFAFAAQNRAETPRGDSAPPAAPCRQENISAHASVDGAGALTERPAEPVDAACVDPQLIAKQ